MYVCLSSLWSRFNSQPWQSISSNFSLADHTLLAHPEPAWHHTACEQWGGRENFNYGQAMAEIEKNVCDDQGWANLGLWGY